MRSGVIAHVTEVSAPFFWVYATGAMHVAAGVAIVTGIRVRLAATLLATMCGLFVLLLHVPRVMPRRAAGSNGP